ncbi:MAG: AAA family ATPase [Planctomycetota bacterium]|nr:AAA family ATPase [Planctomycetota bacterium]
MIDSTPTCDQLPRLGPPTALGGGSMALVERAALADDWCGLAAGSEVVVKHLPPDALGVAELTAALRAEGALGLELRHKDIVRTLALVEDPDAGPHILFEWIPGATLDDVIARGPLPEPLVRDLGAHTAAALAAMHAAGYAHADLKPENLRLDRRGRTRLLDLGLATPLERGANAPGHDPGSLAWMSPERREGGRPTAAADVFALGLVLYAATTGSPPPARPRGSAPPRPSAAAPRLTPFFDELVAATLAWDPAERPTAAELRDAFESGESGTWWQARAWVEPEPRVDAGEAMPEPQGPTLPELSRAPVAFGQVPLVGRDAELRRLAYLAIEAFAGRPAASPLLLYGPEGSGKWQLVHEFATHARRGPEPPLLLAGRMTTMREARPYGTLIGLLRSWLGLGTGQRPGPEHLAVLEGLLPPRGVGTLVGVLDPAHEGRIEGSVSTALIDWILNLAAEEPLIVFLDELQEAGPETLRLVQNLSAAVSKSTRPLRLFLVLGERDDLVEEPSAELRAVAAVSMALGPIDEDAVSELVRRRFDSATPRLALARVLWQRSRGNPGLVEELVAGLEQSGSAERLPDGRLHLVVDPKSMPLPSSLRQSIQERFSRLDPGRRALLAHMATLAGRLDARILRRAFRGLANVDLTSAFADLTRQGWLVAHGDHFRFARPALREAVIAALGDGTARRLHREAATGMAPRPGERASVGGSIRRAWHLREAGLFPELLSALRPTIQVLLHRGQPQRIATLTNWGLEALEEMEAASGELSAEHQDLRVHLLELAAASAGRLGQRARERELLDSLADLGLDADSDPTRATRIYLLHARHARATSSFGLAKGLLKNALDFARRAGRRRLEAEAQVLLALTLADVGDLEGAEEAGEEARSIAEGFASDDPTDLAAAHLALGMVAVLSGRPDRALRQVDRALSLGRRSKKGLPARLKAASHLMRARTWRDLGRPGRARGSATKALEIATYAHERVLEVEAAARLGGLLVDAGKTEEAEARLRDALRLAQEIEDRRGATLARLYLGTLIAEESEGKGAEELARAARDAGELRLYRSQAMALAIEARVHLIRAKLAGGAEGATSPDASKELDEAEQRSAKAHELLERHGAELRDGIVITGTRALVLHHLGRGSQARGLVRNLRRVMRRSSQAIEDTATRRLHRNATTSLLGQVLSAEGPIFPRG